MGAAFLAIAFFGLWAAALVWLLDRLPAEEGADTDAETEADNVALPI
jgi:hypothetical protein